MELPFSREQFFGVFAAYNRAVWPAQLALPLTALLMLRSLQRRQPGAVGWIPAALALLWVWMAVMYHVAFFADINPAANLFALLFLFQAGAIAWHGLRAGRLEIALPKAALPRAIGWILIAYALLLYPFIGHIAGHRYPFAPTFGVPCPTTIFTLGLFSWTVRPLPWTVLAVPVLWSVVGGSAALILGVPEDFFLPVAALALLVSRMTRRGMLQLQESAAR
jgi:hypothetical protein